MDKSKILPNGKDNSIKTNGYYTIPNLKQNSFAPYWPEFKEQLVQNLKSSVSVFLPQSKQHAIKTNMIESWKWFFQGEKEDGPLNQESIKTFATTFADFSLEQVHQVLSLNCFHGILPIRMDISILQSCKSGTFLIRFSNSNSNNFILAVVVDQKISPLVSKCPSIKNVAYFRIFFRLNAETNSIEYFLSEDGPIYTSISHMIRSVSFNLEGNPDNSTIVTKFFLSYPLFRKNIGYLSIDKISKNMGQYISPYTTKEFSKKQIEDHLMENSVSLLESFVIYAGNKTDNLNGKFCLAIYNPKLNLVQHFIILHKSVNVKDHKDDTFLQQVLNPSTMKIETNSTNNYDFFPSFEESDLVENRPRSSSIHGVPVHAIEPISSNNKNHLSAFNHSTQVAKKNYGIISRITAKKPATTNNINETYSFLTPQLSSIVHNTNPSQKVLYRFETIPVFYESLEQFLQFSPFCLI